MRTRSFAVAADEEATTGAGDERRGVNARCMIIEHGGEFAPSQIPKPNTAVPASGGESAAVRAPSQCVDAISASFQRSQQDFFFPTPDGDAPSFVGRREKKAVVGKRQRRNRTLRVGERQSRFEVGNAPESDSPVVATDGERSAVRAERQRRRPTIVGGGDRRRCVRHIPERQRASATRKPTAVRAETPDRFVVAERRRFDEFERRAVPTTKDAAFFDGDERTVGRELQREQVAVDAAAKIAEHMDDRRVERRGSLGEVGGHQRILSWVAPSKKAFVDTLIQLSLSSKREVKTFINPPSGKSEACKRIPCVAARCYGDVVERLECSNMSYCSRASANFPACDSVSAYLSRSESISGLGARARRSTEALVSRSPARRNTQANRGKEIDDRFGSARTALGDGRRRPLVHLWIEELRAGGGVDVERPQVRRLRIAAEHLADSFQSEVVLAAPEGGLCKLQLHVVIVRVPRKKLRVDLFCVGMLPLPCQNVAEQDERTWGCSARFRARREAGVPPCGIRWRRRGRQRVSSGLRDRVPGRRKERPPRGCASPPSTSRRVPAAPTVPAALSTPRRPAVDERGLSRRVGAASRRAESSKWR